MQGREALFFVYLFAQTYLCMHILHKLILFVVLISVVGCTGGYHKDFEKVESLMREHPKDALAVLDSLKKYPIKGKTANARFALLYSQALDKNYIDVTDDSLISIAEAWYTRKGSVREKYLSHYYKGVVNSNAKKYPEAITAFSRAQKYEKELGDNYLLGQLYNQMGYIYESHYDYKKSLEAFVKAHDYYGQAGKLNHKNYMLINIAGCYWNMGDYVNSEIYYKKALDEGVWTNYKSLLEQSVIGLVGQYVEQKRYGEAKRIYEEYRIEITPNRPKYTGNLARMYYMTGDVENGEKLMDLAWKYACTAGDSIFLWVQEYHSYKEMRNQDLAFLNLENAYGRQNHEMSLKLSHPVLEIQKRFLEKDMEYIRYKMMSERKMMSAIVLLIVIIGSFTLYIVKDLLRKKEVKLKGYIFLLAELQDTLHHLQDMMQLKDVQLSYANSNAVEIINKRLNLINKLTTLFYERRGTPKAKEIFMKEVENMIEDFRTNECDFKWMEKLINGSKDNLLEKVYVNYPELSEPERKLLCYIYAGFSPKAISIFLNIPLETVYNRKSRLLAKTGLSKSKKVIR